MGLFNSISRGAAAAHNLSMVSNTRKAIFEIRDRLRNTPQFSEVFYKLIQDPSHPPRHIEANQSGSFWSEAWMPAYNNYEPYTTQKFSDPNIAYIEGCAIYLLIQECYPNVYDFPSNTMDAVANGATIKLIMKKKFVGQALVPAAVPPAMAPAYGQPAAPAYGQPAAPAYGQPAAPAYGQPAAPAYAQPAAPAAPVAPAAAPVREFVFCSQCGTKNTGTARFCGGCGHPLG